MKIRLKVSKASPIGVVTEFPDEPILRVVGKNGVGKSLAANLLAIASGDYQFREELSYRTLRSALRKVEITINMEDEELQAILSPATWLWDEARSNIVPSSLGTFRHQGTTITASEFSRLFSVKIVRGNEGLETRLSDLARALIGAYNKLFDSLLAKGIEVSTLAQTVREALNFRELEFIRDRQDTYLERTKPLGVDPEALAVFSRLLRALAKTGRFSSLDVRMNRLQAILETLVEEQIREEAKLIERRESLEAGLKENKVIDDLRKIEAITREVAEIEDGLPFKDPKLRTSEGVTQEDEQCKLAEEELHALNEEYQRLEFASSVQNEVPKVIVGLGQEYSRDGTMIQDAELLTLRRPRLVRSTRQLLGDFAFSLRRTRETVKRNPAFQNVDVRLNVLRERIESLAKQQQLVRRIQQRNAELGRLRTRLDRIRSGGGKELDALVAKLLRAREIREAGQEALTLIRHSLFSRPNQELSSALDLATKVKAVQLSEAVETLAPIYEQVADLDAEREAIAKETARYFERLDPNELANLPSELQEAVRARNTASIAKVAARLGPLATRDWFEVLREEVVDRINAIVEPGRSGPSEGLDDFYKMINAYLGHILTAQLDQKPFRDFVFRHKVLSVDPSTGTVILEVKGKAETRSLNDYSTGERAFAYSVASILANRRLTRFSILFLDEFGAVLDEDREQYVRRLVQHQMAEEEWPSKAVVMLPYKGELDREEEVAIRSGFSLEETRRRRTEISAKREQLTRLGYYVEALSN